MTGTQGNTNMKASTTTTLLFVSPRRLLWVAFLISIGTVTINYIYVFQNASSIHNNNNNNNHGPPTTATSTAAVLPARPPRETLTAFSDKKLLKGKPPRTLVGIISSDSFNDCTYRKRHRELFDIWNDTRLCALEAVTDDCQVAYTFIIGAGNESAPTQLVNDSSSWPLLVPKPMLSRHEDVNYPDTSLLNIRYVQFVLYFVAVLLIMIIIIIMGGCWIYTLILIPTHSHTHTHTSIHHSENMNEGKSESFVYFASVMMKRHNIDYAMKLDADSILHLHDYLAFAHANLPPYPYYKRIFAGALRNKYHWPKLDSQQVYNRKEHYWKQEQESVHLYLAGQCYLLSRDLVEWVVTEAPRSWNTYREGHEDHDVSAMALKCPMPVTMITISKTQRFWEHPVKGM
jgi:hypothetical protein